MPFAEPAGLERVQPRRVLASTRWRRLRRRHGSSDTTAASTPGVAPGQRNLDRGCQHSPGAGKSSSVHDAFEAGSHSTLSTKCREGPAETIPRRRLRPDTAERGQLQRARPLLRRRHAGGQLDHAQRMGSSPRKSGDQRVLPARAHRRTARRARDAREPPSPGT